MSPLPPNSTIGILGGGQLGRMSALAAAELGFRAHIYGPGADERDVVERPPGAGGQVACDPDGERIAR